MNRLTKGMYGHRWTSDDLFGLHYSQSRYNGEIAHNAGWYNGAGERLGFGSLSVDDLERIAVELVEGEIFIVLGEIDSQFLDHSVDTSALDKEAPGTDYVAEHALFIITRRKVYRVDHYGSHPDQEEFVLRGLNGPNGKTIPATRLHNATAKELIATYTTAPVAQPTC